MSFFIGLDIGGTKIAGALFNADMQELGQRVLPTPHDYRQFLAACQTIIADLENLCGGKASVGIGIPGIIQREKGTVFAPNVLCLKDNPFHRDIETTLSRPVFLGNDANCAALSEAMDGAGAGYSVVFGVIMGTGVGGGLVVNGQIVEGANGLAGEWGHLPLPWRDENDGPSVSCGCGQMGCIDKAASGPALSRLYETLTGKQAEATQIDAMAVRGDAEARKVLDRFYDTVAKAMVTVLHAYDPHVIVVSGGLHALPGMYDEVPKRWGKYAARKDLSTKFLPAKYGAMSGLRGAAWLGRQNSR